MPPYIYFARHGQTNPNLKKYIQSQIIDKPLNKTGRAQATKLGQRLKGEHIINFMVVSPTKRTIETANLIMDVIAPPYIGDAINPDFLEINCGSIDGMYFEELKQKYPALYHAWWGAMANPNDKHRFPFPGGESFRQIVNRGKAAVKSLKSELDRGNILVVGHGSMNSVIIGLLLNIRPEIFFSSTYFENCGLAKIDMDFQGMTRLTIT